jgi:hypothetical protein
MRPLGFVVDEVAMGNIFFPNSAFSPVNTIPPVLPRQISFLYYGQGIPPALSFGGCANMQKANINFVTSVYPSDRPPACDNSAPTRRIFMKFRIWAFGEKIWRENSSVPKI